MLSSLLLALQVAAPTAGAATAGANPSAMRSTALPIAGVPAPDSMLRIVEGTPFTVPGDRLLVITGLTRDAFPLVDLTGSAFTVPNTRALASEVSARFDGEVVFGALLGYTTGGNGASAPDQNVVEVPAGLVAGPGTVVEVSELSAAGFPFELAPTEIRGVLHGYLFDRGAPAVRVPGIPAPDQMRRVTRAAPLVVPSGYRFVVTGVGRDLLPTSPTTAANGLGGFSCTEAQQPSSYLVSIAFDGVAAHTSILSPGQVAPGPLALAAAPNVTLLPPGLVAEAGTTVSVNDLSWQCDGGAYSLLPSAGGGVVLGYLAAR